jgi:phospholipid/cholesterol/gamma-HCH transport system substrate-binding protein
LADHEEQPNVVARVAAGVAIGLAVAVLAILLLSSGNDYTVKARFINASQIVKGDDVQVAGERIGTVVKIKLTDDGQAQLDLRIDKDKPLREGTTAIIRQASLSGVANRYVDLQMGPGTAPGIPDGGKLDSNQTESSVDLDALFNIFDPEARAAVRADIQGFAQTYAGRAEQANAAYHYLNPSLAASSRLFAELSRNKPDLERFIVQTSRLVTDVAERRDDVAGLVDHLATTNSALANQRVALAESIHQLPSFMRKANTTFVNLRATLDDLDPLVTASRPVVRKLRPVLAQLRPFAAEAVPTVRDLSRTIRQAGSGNDLIELLQAQPPVDQIANGPVQANGKQREGAFPATTKALQGATPELGFARPYAVDLTGWFDDFSESGQYDALGSFSRAGLALSAFTLDPVLGLLPVPPALRPANLLASGAQVGRNNRCPGSDERNVDGSNPFRPSPTFNCDPSIQPVGP